MEREFLNVSNRRGFTATIVRSVDGFSMMELMVAIGLSAILLMGVTSMNSFTQNSMNTMHAVLYRDEIVKIVQQLTSAPLALKNSANNSSNTNLNKCAYPPGGGGANPDCTAGTEYPFILMDTMNSPVAGAAPNPISDLSQPGSPIFYSVLDGSICRDAANNPVTSATNVCAFEVVTSFIPTCADTNLCQDPTKMAITFQYRVRITTNPLLNPLKGTTLKTVIAPPAPVSYMNVMSIRNGYFTN